MYTAIERKINEVNKVGKLCFGAPEMFSASQNYLSVSCPPKSGGYGALRCNKTLLVYKFCVISKHKDSRICKFLSIKKILIQ